MKKNRKLLLLLILPILFFCLWVFLSTFAYLKNTGTGFLTLEDSFEKQNLSGDITVNLTKGKIVTGRFVSTHVNLGSISIRFRTFDRINDDKLLFRIREEDKITWFYQAEYKTDQFQPNQLFPFGFPPQKDSKGRSYVFEIESLDGSLFNSVAIGETTPVFVARYTLSKQALLLNPGQFVKFLFIRFQNISKDDQFLSSWRFFVGILSVYCASTLLNNSFIKWFVLLNLATISTIIFDLDHNWVFLSAISLFWFITFIKFKKTSRDIGKIAVTYLFVLMVATLANQTRYLEKISNWVYYLTLMAFLRHMIKKDISSLFNKIASSQTPQIILITVIVGIVVHEISNVYYLPVFRLIGGLQPIFILSIFMLILGEALLVLRGKLSPLFFVIFILKLPFIFHGNWENNFFVTYMTDEVVFLSPIISHVHSGSLSLNEFLIFGYPPFLFNVLYGLYSLLFGILKIMSIQLSEIRTLEIIYYGGRLLVLTATVTGSYFFLKVFRELIPSRFYQGLLIILINFNGLFFLYSTYLKTDNLVWAMGAIAIYQGLVFWKNRNRVNYYKFGLFSLIPSLINYYGYIYILFFALISIVSSTPKNKEISIPIKSKLIFTLVILPILWLLANFELAPKIIEVVYYFIKFATSKNELFVPFFENINNYPSYIFYFDYLKFFLTPILLIFIGLLLFMKKTNLYFKLLCLTMVLFFLQLSTASYRTDRLFIPIYIFAILLVVYLLSQIYNFLLKSKLRFVVALISLALAGPILARTLLLAKTLQGEDTRLTLYKYIQQEVPEKASLTFLHNSIFGAYATSDYLKRNNSKMFDIRVIDLTVGRENERLKEIGGYFIVSAFDLDILRKFGNTPYYGRSFQETTDLIARSKEVSFVDKINYHSEPFGPIDLFPNSLYGIQNPPLLIYKTND